MTGAASSPTADVSMFRRLAVAHDASHFLILPREVVTPDSAAQVAAVLADATRRGQPVTFRSGGTSLSGQAQSAGILADTRRHFRSIEVLDGGRRVRVQPGATVRQVNGRLAGAGFMLGPDPASEAACTIGGVVANNSSGMACGTQFNSYRTIESLVLVLPSGCVVDTAGPDADGRLRHAAPDLHAGLAQLRDKVRADAGSVRTIKRLFAMKNTMGYAVNAFVDFDDPVDILSHLVVGSEGTLAFVAEATFMTVPVRPHVATAFAIFDSLGSATGALPELVASGLAAIELLDATSLRVAQRDPRSGSALPGLAVEGHAGLLVEYQEASAEALAARVEEGQRLLDRLALSLPAQLSTASKRRGDLWHVRKGLYAAVAGARPSGTTALLEDVAVPVAALADTCEGLLHLLDRHGYEESVVFGHARDGNIHFLLNERFDQAETRSRFQAFTEDMVELVLGAGGTLKAEHGTGRMMAPYVRRQYGDELYDVMKRVKELIDPANVLNPGVIISDDPDIHLRDLKTTPAVEEEVDRCVECGYCEPVCPSKDLTLTPRQRIVLRRERARAMQNGDTALVRELDAQYGYEAVDTCAVDGMCATACPVLIDTGDLVRRLRAERHTPIRDAMWAIAARHWAGASTAAGRALSTAQHLPSEPVTRANSLARRITGPDSVPLWDRGLPGGGPRRTSLAVHAPEAVYFPACVGTMFGPEPGRRGVQDAFLRLCQAAGIAVTIPEGIASACCGTPWKSKGMTAGYQHMQNRVTPWLILATDNGRVPVVTDASSCTEGLQHLLAGVRDTHGTAIDVIDAVQFTADRLLPLLEIPVRLPSLALHPTCSTVHLGLGAALNAVAQATAVDVSIPHDWGCCAFAGDRGLLHPELTSSATAPERRELKSREFTAYASANRTCELGLTRATGKTYRHILEILADLLTPAR